MYSTSRCFICWFCSASHRQLALQLAHSISIQNRNATILWCTVKIDWKPSATCEWLWKRRNFSMHLHILHVKRQSRRHYMLHACLHVHIDVNRGPCRASLDTWISVYMILFRWGWWIMLTHCHVWVENYSLPSRLPRLGRDGRNNENLNLNTERNETEMQTRWLGLDRKNRSLRCVFLILCFRI